MEKGGGGKGEGMIVRRGTDSGDADREWHDRKGEGDGKGWEWKRGGEGGPSMISANN
jgi:hypothetical protein